MAVDKGGLFVVLGCIASLALLVRAPEAVNGILLLISIWAFCRAYYFAFYVVEHYADPSFRFDGLFAFWDYLIHRSRAIDGESPIASFSPNEATRESYRIKTLGLQSFCLCTIANYFVPVIAFRVFAQQNYNYHPIHGAILALLLGLAAAEFWLIGVVAALSTWNIRFRLPMTVGIAFVLSICLFLAIFRERSMSDISVVVGLMAPMATFAISFCTHGIVRLCGGRIELKQTNATAFTGQSQIRWGIGYLFFLCTLVACLIALAARTFSGVSWTGLFRDGQLWMIFAFLTTVLSTGGVACLLAVPMTLFLRPTRMQQIACGCFLLTVIFTPIAAAYLFRHFARVPLPPTNFVVDMYVFTATFALAVLTALFALRHMGIRLRTATRTPNLSGQPMPMESL